MSVLTEISRVRLENNKDGTYFKQMRAHNILLPYKDASKDILFQNIDYDKISIDAELLSEKIKEYKYSNNYSLEVLASRLSTTKPIVKTWIDGTFKTVSNNQKRRLVERFGIVIIER